MRAVIIARGWQIPYPVSTVYVVTETESYERVLGAESAPLFLTCEHASQRLPARYAFVGPDQRLIGTHWAYDLGARELVLELAQALAASAVLARYSRLLIDPNRAEDHPDLFRQSADGSAVLLNQDVRESERRKRIDSYYHPYHAAVDATLAQVSAPTLLSIHTFTPIYEGQVRQVELGVLFDTDDGPAEALLSALRAVYPAVAANEPWSGKDGLIYSAERHAHRHGRIALELEVRQDLATDATWRQKLVAVLVDFYRKGK